MNFWNLFKKAAPKTGDPATEAAKSPAASKPWTATPKPVVSSTQEPPKKTAQEEQLILAVQNSRLDEVRSLVEAGTNVNVIEMFEGLAYKTFRMETYKRPLIHCVLNKDYPTADELRLWVQIIQLLLDAGADIDARDEHNSNKTLLMRAASNRQAELVGYLIERGANSNLKDSDGNTAFGTVRKRNSWDDNEVTAILAKSTDDGKAWLDSNAGKAWIRATWVDEKAPIPTVRGDTCGVLQAALTGVENEQFNKIVRWAKNGGDLEWRDPNGWTVLHIAAQCANEKMVRFLLDHGANIEALDDEGGTPLMLACNFGFTPFKPSSAIISLLLDVGANPNTQDKAGNTALKLIRGSGLEEAQKIAQILIDRGAISTPGKDSPCSECGSPYSEEMAKRGVQVTFDGAFARLSCPRCSNALRAPLETITQLAGGRVKCSCGAIAWIPPTVWCKTCKQGLSSGWQEMIKLM